MKFDTPPQLAKKKDNKKEIRELEEKFVKDLQEVKDDDYIKIALKYFYSDTIPKEIKTHIYDLLYTDPDGGGAFVATKKDSTFLAPFSTSVESFEDQLSFINGRPEKIVEDTSIVESFHYYCVLLKDDLPSLGQKFENRYKDLKKLAQKRGREIAKRNYFLGRYLENINLSPPWDQGFNPKEISPSMYVAINGHEVSISDGSPVSAKKIFALKKKFDTLAEKTHADYYSATTRDKPDPTAEQIFNKRQRELGELRQKLKSYFSTPQGQDFFTVSTPHIPPEGIPTVFRFMSQGGVRDVFEKTFNVGLNSFSFPEQFRIFEFMYTAGEDTVMKIKSLSDSKKFGVTFFRTFLSIEQGGKEMGDKIIKIAEKLPYLNARMIFKKYSEIIDSANKITEVLKNRFGKEETPELANAIRENVLKKAKIY